MFMFNIFGTRGANNKGSGDIIPIKPMPQPEIPKPVTIDPQPPYTKPITIITPAADKKRIAQLEGKMLSINEGLKIFKETGFSQVPESIRPELINISEAPYGSKQVISTIVEMHAPSGICVSKSCFGLRLHEINDPKQVSEMLKVALNKFNKDLAAAVDKNIALATFKKIVKTV